MRLVQPGRCADPHDCQKGRITLPDGMNYRLLALPDARTMTPRLLTKIAALVDAGAIVVGPPPVRSPSLEDYPNADARVQTLAAALWGNCDNKTIWPMLTAKAALCGAARPPKRWRGWVCQPTLPVGREVGSTTFTAFWTIRLTCILSPIPVNQPAPCFARFACKTVSLSSGGRKPDARNLSRSGRSSAARRKYRCIWTARSLYLSSFDTRPRR